MTYTYGHFRGKKWVFPFLLLVGFKVSAIKRRSILIKFNLPFSSYFFWSWHTRHDTAKMSYATGFRCLRAPIGRRNWKSRSVLTRLLPAKCPPQLIFNLQASYLICKRKKSRRNRKIWVRAIKLAAVGKRGRNLRRNIRNSLVAYLTPCRKTQNHKNLSQHFLEKTRR